MKRKNIERIISYSLSATGFFASGFLVGNLGKQGIFPSSLLEVTK